jgi:hypothetical protein
VTSFCPSRHRLEFLPQDFLLLAQGAKAVIDAEDTMEDARRDLTASSQEHQGRRKEQEVQGAKFVLARHNYLKSLAAQQEELTKQQEVTQQQDSREIDVHAKVPEYFVSRVKSANV